MQIFYSFIQSSYMLICKMRYILPFILLLAFARNEDTKGLDKTLKYYALKSYTLERKAIHILIRDTVNENERIQPPFKKATIARYLHCLYKYTKQHDLTPYRMQLALQIKEESHFYYGAIGDNWCSFGSAQINPFFAKDKIQLLDNGELGKHINKRIKQGKKIYYSIYLRKIGYNLELQCMIMRDYLKQYNDYPLSLLAYNMGQNSIGFKKYRTNAMLFPYVKEIKSH